MMQDNLMLPASDKLLIDTVAKAVGRSRVMRDAKLTAKELYKINIEDNAAFMDQLEKEFDALWASDFPQDRAVKESWREDAITMLGATNLFLVTNTPT